VVLDQPYAIVTANVLVASTQEQAEREAAPGQLMIYGVRTGRFSPLLSPDEAAVHPHLAAAKAMPSNRIVGSPRVACERLDELAASTHADELMISTVAHSIASRRRSLELLAHAWSTDRAAA
jgi:alkanesulfonate monooxygenase SsuD/methylene tetrahydromethanopterin reductase-like flavin-dependent oxidoreductase (luciferase family)